MQRLLAAACYIPFLFIVVLFLSRNPFVVFHIRQGFVLSFLWLVWLFVWRFLPVIGWALLAPVGLIALTYLSLYGFTRSLMGLIEPLPVIGTWPDRFRL